VNASAPRAAIVELALCIGSLLGASTIAWTLLRLGVTPPFGSDSASLGLLLGPFITGAAAVIYVFAGRSIDELNQVARPSVLEPKPVHRTLGIVGLGIVAAIVGSFVLGQVMTLFGVPVEEQTAVLEMVENAKKSGHFEDLALLAVAATVLAPLTEEWLFRGLLFRRLQRDVGLAEAYVLSAVAFSAIHTNPTGIVIYVWLGIVFAATLQRTGRIWAAVLVHMGNNALALTALFFA